MIAMAKSAELFSPIAMSMIQDGDYPGVWGGYVVEAVINGSQYRFQSDTGIRTINAACIVRVRGSVVTFEIE